jgi:hypothetical protein
MVETFRREIIVKERIVFECVDSVAFEKVLCILCVCVCSLSYSACIANGP